MRAKLTPAAAEALPPAERAVVLVPYRDTPGQGRAPQLAAFVKRFSGIAEVIVVEQSDDGRKFNRGALLNAGVAMLSGVADVVLLHDVDLLPDDELVTTYYGRKPPSPLHLAASWKKYNYETFLGGVVSLTVAHYRRIDGFPNNFWGWGGEDDVFASRATRARLRVLQPTVGAYHDTQKNWTQDNPLWKNLRKPAPIGGLKTVEYTVLARKELAPGVVKVTVELA